MNEIRYIQDLYICRTHHARSNPSPYYCYANNTPPNNEPETETDTVVVVVVAAGHSLRVCCHCYYYSYCSQSIRQSRDFVCWAGEAGPE